MAHIRDLHRPEFLIDESASYGGTTVFTVIDSLTGVNYIGVAIMDCSGPSVSITPRLNRDGKLFISE